MDRIRLLYVDAESHPVERRARRLGREFGFEVTTATSVEAGRHHVGARPFDCVLAGPGLPEDDCLELLERARTEDPGLPFVVLAPEASGQLERALAAGATDYVPVSVLDGAFGLLAHRLERVVAGRAGVDRTGDTRSAETDGGTDGDPAAELFEVVRRAVGVDATDGAGTPDDGSPSGVGRSGDSNEFEWTPVGGGTADFDWTPVADGSDDDPVAEDGREEPDDATGTGADAGESGPGGGMLEKLLGDVDLESEAAADEPLGTAADEPGDAGEAGRPAHDRVTDSPGTDGGRMLPPPDAQASGGPAVGAGSEPVRRGDEEPGYHRPDDGSPAAAGDPALDEVDPDSLALDELPRDELLALLERLLDRDRGGEPTDDGRGTGPETGGASPREDGDGQHEAGPTEDDHSPPAGTDAPRDGEAGGGRGVDGVEPEQKAGDATDTGPRGGVDPGQPGTGTQQQESAREDGDAARSESDDGGTEDDGPAGAAGDGEPGPGDGSAGQTGPETAPDTGWGGGADEAADLMGAVEYDRPDDLDLDPGTSVLVQCGSQDDRAEAACTDLVGLNGGPDRNVLLVRYRQMDEGRIEEIASRAARTKIITVGYTQPVPQSVRDTVENVKINNPNDVTRLGIVVTSTMDDWASAPGETVVCYDPLDVLLRYKNVKSAFRFLHLLLGKLQSAGAVSHFHVDPSAGDPQEINTLKPLFDAVLTIDSVGTHVERQ
jgi:CheY-like chemotaxis protein